MSFPNLFSPIRLGGMEVMNRIVSTGHDTVMAHEGHVTDRLIAYHAARAKGGAGLRRSAAVAQAAAFTLLNPHVYLDTVLLVGSIGAQQPAALRGWFIAGASGASLFWFALLGFGARWLAPWFARPRSWQALDGLIGVTMFVLSALLVRHALIGI